MDRRFFLLGAAALPGAALASPSADGGRGGAVELLGARLVNRERFADQPQVSAGARLVLRRDPAWTYDPNAIAVFTEQGEGLGYLPPTRTQALAALMDAGIRLEGRATPEAAALRVSVWAPARVGTAESVV